MLCINKDDTKTEYDCMAISKDFENNLFEVAYNADFKVGTIKYPKTVMTKRTHHDVLEYLQDCLDLLFADADKNPYHSIDLLIPGRPVVSLDTKAAGTAPLLLRTIRNWCINATN